MEYYNKKLSPRYDMGDFLRLRKKPHSYLVFYRFFIKCVTKKTRYDKNVETARTYNDICTVSDEAFALLLLENSWDKWSDLYERDPMSLVPRRGGRGLVSVASPIMTKYTKGGYKLVDTENGATAVPTSFGSSKGWSTEGMRRYNQLFDLIEADRTAHPEFLDVVLDDLKSTKMAKKKKKTEAKKEPLVKIRHNLFKNSRKNWSATDSQPISPSSGVWTSQSKDMEEHSDAEADGKDLESERTTAI